jgi:hypothetical protein
VTGREPDDLAAGEREPVGGAGFRLFGSVPISGVIRCGQCRWLQSSLRVAPAVAGGHGAVRVRGGSLGGVNQVGARAARVGAAGQTTQRSRAWPLAAERCSCGPYRRLAGGLG